MGTIKNQLPRNYQEITAKEIIYLCEIISEISLITKLTIEQVTEIFKLKELQRKNNLYVVNGDIFDEQISGLATILENKKV